MQRPPSVVQLLLALVLAATAFASAQTPATRVLLVLDASGSMYRTLPDGRTRIAAAKEALAAFVARLPAGAGLDVGLRVYGTRIQALDADACEDTSLLVPVAGFDRDALQNAVRDTQPLGATPIAYALERAGDDLAMGPGPAVIVLVTDGEESCGGDLHGALAALAARGLDVDLRIVGIDLSDLAARGFGGLGTFENVASAADLAAALGRTVAVAEAPVRHRATVALTRDGAPARDGAAVRFVDALSGTAFDFGVGDDGLFAAELPAGGYRAEVADAFAPAPLVVGGITITAEAPNAFAFELAPSATVALTIDPVAPAAGGTVQVAFSGAPAEGGWVALAPTAADDAAYLTYATAAAGDREVAVRVPETTEALEARYLIDLPEGGSRVIGRSDPFTPFAIAATVAAPESVPAGTTFDVAWTGPALDGDFVTVVAAGADDGAYASYQYAAATGSPTQLVASPEPGRYEVRYVTGGAGTVLARAAFDVVASAATLTAPDEVVAGAGFEVSWTGPNGPRDYVTVVPAGAEVGAYLDYRYTEDGSPVSLTAPIEPGAYEVRYVVGQDDRTLTSAAIQVTAVTATVAAPAQVASGATFDVAWTGPSYDRDYVTIVPVGAAEGSYLSYAYTRDGNPAQLGAPDEPGSYEVRYVTGADDATLARTAIEVR